MELKVKYDNPEHSLVLVNDGDYWKLAVRDHYLPVVKKIVTETELSRTVLETLAVIAFKYPIKQSDLIHIRTNKAYDHLKELEQEGFISRKKHGRTNLIKLTDKFFQYFDLPEEKLKQHLADFQSIAAAIAQKETELHERRSQREKELEELKSKEQNIQKAIDSLDDAPQPMPTAATTNDKIEDAIKLETYGAAEDEAEQKVEVKVYDVPPEVASKESKPWPKDEDAPPKSDVPSTEPQAQPSEIASHAKEELQSDAEPWPEAEKLTETHFEGFGIQPTLEQEKEIDEKVEKLLHPPKEDSKEPELPRDEDELEEELDRAKQRRKPRDD
jgi:segregation and condensation protein B